MLNPGIIIVFISSLLILIAIPVMLLFYWKFLPILFKKYEEMRFVKRINKFLSHHSGTISFWMALTFILISSFFVLTSLNRIVFSNFVNSYRLLDLMNDPANQRCSTLIIIAIPLLLAFYWKALPFLFEKSEKVTFVKGIYQFLSRHSGILLSGMISIFIILFSIFVFYSYNRAVFGNPVDSVRFINIMHNMTNQKWFHVDLYPVPGT